MNELIWIAIISSTFTCSGISRNTNKVFMSHTSTGIIQQIEKYPLQEIQFYKAQKLDISISGLIFQDDTDTRPLCETCKPYPTFCSFDNNLYTFLINENSCFVRLPEGKGYRFCDAHKKHGMEYRHKK